MPIFWSTPDVADIILPEAAAAPFWLTCLWAVAYVTMAFSGIGFIIFNPNHPIYETLPKFLIGSLGVLLLALITSVLTDASLKTSWTNEAVEVMQEGVGITILPSAMSELYDRALPSDSVTTMQATDTLGVGWCLTLDGRALNVSGNKPCRETDMDALKK